MLDTIVIIDSGKIVFNYSMVEISDKLFFTQQQDLSLADKALYFEKNLGSYTMVQENKQKKECVSEVDLEVLFNMVINDTKRINSIIGSIKRVYTQ